MTEVGIRELKARASEFVQRAQEGESIVVTRRGHPVARLVAASPADGLASVLAEPAPSLPAGATTLADLVSEGRS